MRRPNDDRRGWSARRAPGSSARVRRREDRRPSTELVGAAAFDAHARGPEKGYRAARSREDLSFAVDRVDALQRDGVRGNAHVALSLAGEIAHLAITALHGALEATVHFVFRPGLRTLVLDPFVVADSHA